MNPATTTQPANYTLAGATVTNVILWPDAVTVLLQLDRKLAGGTFAVNIDGVKDAALNPVSTNVTGSLVWTQIGAALDIGVGTNALGAGVLRTNAQPALTNLTFDVNYPGSTVMVTNGVFEILASGLDVANNQDGFHYVCEPRTGDFDVKVRVDGLTAANAFTRAGLMLRENLTPGSRRYHIVADPPSTPAADGSGNGQNRVEVNFRATPDGVSANWPNNPNPANLGPGNTAKQIPGLWLRLKLAGNNLYAYTGADGTNWALAARATLAANWPKTNYLGMCATAHHTNALAGSYTTAWLSQYGDFIAPTNQQALFLLGNEANVPPGSPNAPQQSSDALAYNQLLALGYNVTVVHLATSRAEDAEGKSVILWSSTTTSGDSGTPLSLWANVPVALLTWENGALQKLNMTTAAGSTVAAQTLINITNATSPLAMGLSGAVTVSSSAAYLYASKTALGSNAIVVASQSGDDTRTVFFAYDQGGAMAYGTNLAPHRRVGIFLDDATPNLLNANGLKLFTNAIQWAAATSEAPTIWTQPANQAVAAGNPATFIVTAVGPGPYAYQWTKVAGGLTNDIVGATSRDYPIMAATAADDGTRYRVKVTGINSGLSATSAFATLTLQWPVVITVQPQNQIGSVGSTATFAVGITNNASAPIVYQWWQVIPAVSTNAISGATSSSYTTPALTATNHGAQYYVVASNPLNSVTSSTATLTISSQPQFNAPMLSPDRAQLTLNWIGGGFLLEATNITGPWVTNGAAGSVIIPLSPNVPTKFFKVQQ
jgi:hypothetical protein